MVMAVDVAVVKSGYDAVWMRRGERRGGVFNVGKVIHSAAENRALVVRRLKCLRMRFDRLEPLPTHINAIGGLGSDQIMNHGDIAVEGTTRSKTRSGSIRNNYRGIEKTFSEWRH
jgi:hypothetical protein